MQFILEIWPDLDDDASAQELLACALNAIRVNPDLVWDIVDDDNRLIHQNVRL